MRRRFAVLAAVLAGTVLPVADAAPPDRAAAPAATGEWLAGDLHVHTPYSHDSYGGPGDDNTGPDEGYTLGLTTAQQFALAGSRGLDYLAITDHNDLRSAGDPGFGSAGVIGVRGYENSLDGHAQMLGAARLHDNGTASEEDVARLASELRAEGGAFQVNHPKEGATHADDLDWSYGHAVVPDSVEVWNIARLYQPPFPSASDNDGAIAFWEGFLDAGHRVAATGGSDSHWASTSAVQGVGNPTTWVFSADRSSAGILEGIRRGRTTISARPPAYGGARVFLEGDVDRDGVFEAMVGDAVPARAPLRVRVEGAPGALVRLVTDGGRPLGADIVVTGPSFEHRLAAPAGSTWLRADVLRPDARDAREAGCDPLVGTGTTYCRNLLLVEAMTSALYVEPRRSATGSARGSNRPAADRPRPNVR